jgi:hypothetical protein
MIEFKKGLLGRTQDAEKGLGGGTARNGSDAVGVLVLAQSLR